MSDISVQFYTNSHDAWQAMLTDLKNATRTIDIEQYIFTVDGIGRHFIKMLTDKAKAGVKIRMLCDMAGSFTFYRSPVPDELRALGIDVRFFNIIQPWRVANFTSFFFRNHRKTMVIDGEIGHLGGVGIKETFADWRDTHMRFTGPIVPDITVSFESIWQNIRRRFVMKVKQSHHFVRNFDVLSNAPGLGQRQMYQTLIAAIRNARREILLTSPYFIPDRRLMRVLVLAAKRGVSVQLLVPEIADHIFIDHARESYYSRALKAGIKIFSYQPTMMHAKTAVIDDWATAGSYNLDNLSAYFNHEVNIGSTDQTFINTIKGHFLRDLTQSKEEHLKEWEQRSLYKKTLELLTWPFHAFM